MGLALFLLKLAPWGWRAVTDAQAELRSRAELLERMRADIRAADLLEDSAVVVKTRLATLAPRLLTGPTGAEARADLGARLAAAAARHRVRVSRTDPVADSVERWGLGWVAVRTTLESDTRGLLGFLEAVRQEPAVLVIDGLGIAVADPLVPADRPEQLRTDLTVRGWFLPGGASR